MRQTVDADFALSIAQVVLTRSLFRNCPYSVYAMKPKCYERPLSPNLRCQRWTLRHRRRSRRSALLRRVVPGPLPGLGGGITSVSTLRLRTASQSRTRTGVTVSSPFPPLVNLATTLEKLSSPSQRVVTLRCRAGFLPSTQIK